MISDEEVYRIGQVTRTHGVKGEVALSFTDDVWDRAEADYLVLRVDGILVPFFMEEYRFKSDETALMKFCDIDTQEQARRLTGARVFFPRALSDSSEEGLSWSEIAGFSLMDAATGQLVGTIAQVDDSTINTLFDIHTPKGDSLLIPAHAELIEKVDAEAKTIWARLPEGILDI